jgi:hypothetical protein
LFHIPEYMLSPRKAIVAYYVCTSTGDALDTGTACGLGHTPAFYASKAILAPESQPIRRCPRLPDVRCEGCVIPHDESGAANGRADSVLKSQLGIRP